MASTAERVALIRLCQEAGFKLGEIGELLAPGSRHRQVWTRLVESKIHELDARIAEAQQARRLLRHALECPHRDLVTCPSFRDALETRLDAAQESSQHN
jgi:DNA-binding transcriptional MerR regulator